MRANLTIVENNTKRRTLVFFSFDDARRFLQFMNIYVDESGCGNGYSAYWPNWVYIPGFRFLPFTDGFCINSRPWPNLLGFNPEKNKINIDFIKGMLYRILRARLAAENPDISEFKWSIEQDKQGIIFDCDEFPLAQRPQKGDMYRIPRRHFGNKLDILTYYEGRVIEDLGDVLKVISTEDSFFEVKNPKIYTVEAEKTIKIFDYQSRYN